MKILLKFIPNHFLTFCMGQFANSKNKFIKNFFINTFIKIYKPDLSIAKKRKAKDYISYNNFFTRELKDDARPINLSENIICSPVDGSIIDFGLIEDGQLIQAKKFKYKLVELIGSSPFVEELEGGVFITIYLAPADYHRIHCPLKGKIIESDHMGDNLYSVNRNAQNIIPSLYVKNERANIIIQSDKFSYGLVAVGASVVGSIVPFWEIREFKKRLSYKESWEKGPEEGSKKVNKGQELAYFKMGSTVILLFPQTAKLNINSLYQDKTVKFGERLVEIKAD
ncbi:MAG TPA: phosphatidylserine decarboxylase [Gammaproteobacteria bacterium]|nr:phosphatidylserine decarboxylase [Gammaproteobacteria bacterium]HIK72498.1 phosphatidylserine decarboxylase [Gammaproteobacteria bacterium]